MALARRVTRPSTQVRLQLQGSSLLPGQTPKYRRAPAPLSNVLVARCSAAPTPRRDAAFRAAWHAPAAAGAAWRSVVYPGGAWLTPFATRGLLGTLAAVAREEGPKSLWKGLEPGALHPSLQCHLSLRGDSRVVHARRPAPPVPVRRAANRLVRAGEGPHRGQRPLGRRVAGHEGGCGASNRRVILLYRKEGQSLFTSVSQARSQSPSPPRPTSSRSACRPRASSRPGALCRMARCVLCVVWY